MYEGSNRTPRRIGFVQLLILFSTFLLVVAFFFLHLFVFPLTLQVGQVVPYTIASPLDTEWVDSEVYEDIMTRAREGDRFLDTTVREVAASEMNKMFSKIYTLRASELPLESKVEQLENRYPPNNIQLQQLLICDEDRLVKFQTEAVSLLKKYMDGPLNTEDVNIIQENALKGSHPLEKELAISFIRPNLMQYQTDKPEELFKDYFTFKMNKGDIIISEGQVVTRQVLDKHAAVSQGRMKQDRLTFAGLTLMFLIILALWVYYLTKYKRSIIENPASLSTVFGIMVLCLAVSLVIIRIPFQSFYYAVSLPLMVGSILTCVIFDPIFALYLYGSLALLISWLFSFNTDLLIFNIVGVVAPPAFLNRFSDRKRIIKLGFILAAINIYLVGIVILVGVQVYSISPFVIAGACGIAAAIFAIGSQGLLDQIAVPLTRTKLTDLCDTNSSLLHQLMLKAPGTYNHSLVMAQMAEEAARSLGADFLLARVGALYHDIGKIAQPQFFAENIRDLSKNPHNRLEPKSSYNIIIKHIEGGVELARKSKLPREIIDFIVTHHGTSVMKYFYQAALDCSAANSVSLDEYSYPGPIPFTIETTIINLADSVEAIVRARELSERDEIREVVESVIDEKIKTGQLADSEVSVKALTTIGDVFVSVLAGIYHGRVKYPEDIARENALKSEGEIDASNEGTAPSEQIETSGGAVEENRHNPGTESGAEILDAESFLGEE